MFTPSDDYLFPSPSLTVTHGQDCVPCTFPLNASHDEIGSVLYQQGGLS